MSSISQLTTDCQGEVSAEWPGLESDIPPDFTRLVAAGVDPETAADIASTSDPAAMDAEFMDFDTWRDIAPVYDLEATYDSGIA